MDIKSTDENDEKFEKVRECLKETFTKFVKTENVHLNQSLSCDDSTVNDVLKYFKINEKKKKKSKKSLKRKFDSDYSENDEILKKARFDNNLLLEDTSEKKKKRVKRKNLKKNLLIQMNNHSKKSLKKNLKLLILLKQKKVWDQHIKIVKLKTILIIFLDYDPMIGLLITIIPRGESSITRL